MPRQSFDIRKDEQLFIEIRKHPCLLDKSNAGYKEKDRVENTWKETIVIRNGKIVWKHGPRLAEF